MRRELRKHCFTGCNGHESPGGIRANRRRPLIVTTASVTSLLDTLERRGLVERRPAPGDRRRLLVAITPPAQQLVQQYVPQIVALQAALMKDIPEHKRQQAIAVLRQIHQAIEAVDV